MATASTITITVTRTTLTTPIIITAAMNRPSLVIVSLLMVAVTVMTSEQISSE